MKIDFHVHGKITSSFPFDREKFLLAIDEAKEGGLNSIALTEHCHADNFLEGYEYLSNNYNLVDDYYYVDGFKVFYGMEVTTLQKLDILIIGVPLDIISLKEEISEKYNYEEFIDINKLFELIEKDRYLVILAHPYRKHEKFPELSNTIWEKIDATEFNATDLYKNGIEEMQEKVLKLAKINTIPIICGSDTHHYIQISSVKNIFTKDCTTVKEIKEEIKKQNYKTELSSDLKVRVKSAKIIKKLTKELGKK